VDSVAGILFPYLHECLFDHDNVINFERFPTDKRGAGQDFEFQAVPVMILSVSFMLSGSPWNASMSL
jgi:hypothetical protein